MASHDASDRTLTKVVVGFDTVEWGWRRFLDGRARRREARRRARAEEAQRGYRPSRYHLLERGLLGAVIGIACILSFSLLGRVLIDFFETVGSKL